MKTLEQEWEEYRAEVVIPEVPPELVEVIRATFFHGALVLYNRLVSQGGISEAELEQSILDASRELHAWSAAEIRRSGRRKVQ